MSNNDAAQETTDTPKSQEVDSEIEQPSFWSQFKAVMSNRTYAVFLVTNWLFGIGSPVGRYVSLFLRDMLLYNYILIGFLSVFFTSLGIVAQLIGGYIGDNYDRKKLAILTMLMNGIGFLVVGSSILANGGVGFTIFGFNISLVLIIIFTGFSILSITNIVGSGSTSYIYDHIPQEYAGVAIGIFQTTAGFGLLGLGIITWWLWIGTPFVMTVQYGFLFGGSLFIIAAIIRVLYLAPAKPVPREKRSASNLRDFLSQNNHARKMILAILPVFLGVLILDAVSDGLYNFVNMYFLNEGLAFSVGEISLMLVVVLALSIPLSIRVGGFFDQRGGRRAIFVVYSVMPICIALLLVAPIFPYWLPMFIIAPYISIPFLKPLLSTAFIAITLKNINDILWGTLILVYLRQAIPRGDTAKMLSITFTIVAITGLFTPVPAAFAYTFVGAPPVLVISLLLNFVILIVLALGNIEPRTVLESE
jgi:MFS family permease